ncbi:hypothetical protein KY284_011653 [Solanum tuberosum]|nr:hypothetical protein KY284_011653 [Solanum tuberosum]
MTQMVKTAGSILIGLNENWIFSHEKKEKPAYIEPEDEVYSVTEENEAIPPTPRVVSEHCQGP